MQGSGGWGGAGRGAEQRLHPPTRETRIHTRTQAGPLTWPRLAAAMGRSLMEENTSPSGRPRLASMSEKAFGQWGRASASGRSREARARVLRCTPASPPIVKQWRARRSFPRPSLPCPTTPPHTAAISPRQPPPARSQPGRHIHGAVQRACWRLPPPDRKVRRDTQPPARSPPARPGTAARRLAAHTAHSCSPPA